MSLEALKSKLPDYAKDLRMNLGALATVESLTPRQLWGSVLVSAIAARNPEVLAALASEAERQLGPEVASAAKGVAAVMAMNNVYYRFLHLSGNEEYSRLPARLRMQALASTAADKLDLELWALAVSAINGCGRCIESHDREVRSKGANAAMVQDVVRIASVVNAVAATIGAETALAAREGYGTDSLTR
jgi:alkyl hydroperoxide reductase subunit D